MIVNVYCPSKDKHFSLDVGQDLTLDDFKALCSLESGVSPQEMRLFLNSQPLSNSSKTLKSYNVMENDIFLLQTAISPQSTQSQGGAAVSMPKIDFTNVRVPGTSTSQPPPQQATRFHGGRPANLDDPETLRAWLLNSPHDLALLKERNPPLADALLSGDLKRFATEFQKIREANLKAEREKIQMMNADPMDLEVQKKIAEEIKRKNIEENMNMAIEEAPESFGQVVMLWINLKVNGHHVKAFVDSGAQMTIMSANCAQRCNIMRLVDKRWEGIAKGVGTQKIIGRIHLAQIQIEDVFLQCSFSVLEDQPMDVLLGLDMLRRHLCVIDLKENALVIGTTSTKTKFLSESELPSHGRLHDPNAPSTSSLKNTEEEDVSKALLESAAEAIEREDKKQNASISPPDAMTSKQQSNTNSASPSASSPMQTDEVKVQQLVTMGFPRSAAEEELVKVNGDVQRAIVNLLMKNMNKT